MKRIKGLKLLLFTLLVLVPVTYVFAAGGITVSKTSLSITAGGSATFKITASNAAGKVSISSSDKSVATVNASSKWVENGSVTITVKGIKEGTATISVKIDDAATYDGKVLSGTKTIKVTVKKKTVVTKKMSITNFEVIGYDIGFKADKKEYTVEISPDVTKLYVLVQGSNFKATGNNVVNIVGKDSITVTLKDDVETRQYVIKINRTEKEEEKPEEVVQPEIPEDTGTKIAKGDVNKYLKYAVIGLAALVFLLLILLIASKKKNNKKDLKVLEDNYSRMPDFMRDDRKPVHSTPTRVANETPPVQAIPETKRVEPTRVEPVRPATSRPEAPVRVNASEPPTRPVVTPRPVDPAKRTGGLDVPDFVALSDVPTQTYTGISLGEKEIVSIDDNN